LRDVPGTATLLLLAEIIQQDTFDQETNVPRMCREALPQRSLRIGQRSLFTVRAA
jgi:hypothetical protein